MRRTSALWEVFVLRFEEEHPSTSPASPAISRFSSVSDRRQRKLGDTPHGWGSADRPG